MHAAAHLARARDRLVQDMQAQGLIREVEPQPPQAQGGEGMSVGGERGVVDEEGEDGEEGGEGGYWGEKIGGRAGEGGGGRR